MKLDKRIENERLIYTPFTTTKPKLHEKGYFTDDIHTFNSLEDCDCRYGELVEHDDVDYAYPYCCEYDDGCGDGSTTCDWYAFYIPESSLKREEKEKKYRPFDPATFEQHFDIGSVIEYRKKDEKNRIYKETIESTSRDYNLNEFYVEIGEYTYTLSDMFEDFELFENGEWKPFGVEE